MFERYLFRDDVTVLLQRLAFSRCRGAFILEDVIVIQQELRGCGDVGISVFRREYAGEVTPFLQHRILAFRGDALGRFDEPSFQQINKSQR